MHIVAMKRLVFAGTVPSTCVKQRVLLPRWGLAATLGRGLQLRLKRSLVSDTTDNLVSANNFIVGYRLYEPETPWAWSNTLYCRKPLG